MLTIKVPFAKYGLYQTEIYAAAEATTEAINQQRRNHSFGKDCNKAI
jgi:hypothetical protein